MSKRRHFNDTYKKLVEDDDDLVGMIAYALYKRSKIEYCESINKTNGYIDENSLSTFYKTQNTEHQLKNYRKEATNIFANLSEKLFIQKRHELLEHFQKHIQSDMNEHTKNVNSYFDIFNQKISENNKFSWTSFSLGIVQNIVASVLWLGIVFLIWWSLSSKKQEETKNKAIEIITGSENSNPSTKPDSTKH